MPFAAAAAVVWNVLPLVLLSLQLRERRGCVVKFETRSQEPGWLQRRERFLGLLLLLLREGWCCYDVPAEDRKLCLWAGVGVCLEFGQQERPQGVVSAPTCSVKTERRGKETIRTISTK